MCTVYEVYVYCIHISPYPDAARKAQSRRCMLIPYRKIIHFRHDGAAIIGSLRKMYNAMDI